MDDDVAAGLGHVFFALSGLGSCASLTQGEGAKTAPSPWAAFFCPFGAVDVLRRTRVGRLSQAKFGALEFCGLKMAERCDRCHSAHVTPEQSNEPSRKAAKDCSPGRRAGFALRPG